MKEERNNRMEYRKWRKKECIRLVYIELGKDTYSSTKIAFAKDEKVTKQGKNGWSSIVYLFRSYTTRQNQLEEYDIYIIVSCIF